MIYIKICEACGKEFTSRRSNANSCSTECRKEINRKNATIRKRKILAQRRRTKQNLSVTEIAVLAKAHGMSYGEYVARMEEGAI